MWDVEEKEGISGEDLEGNSSQVHLDLVNWNTAHHYVLTNTTAMVDWVK
jgi:hypothetical protein